MATTPLIAPLELRERARSININSSPLNEDTFAFPPAVATGFFQVGREFEPAKVSHRFNAAEREKMSHYESLDYYAEETALYKEKVATDPPPSMVTKWVMFIAIGSVTGFVSWILFLVILALSETRKEWLLDALVPGKPLGAAWAIAVVPGAVLALLGSLVVILISPAAAGSGVPDVMAYLNGVVVPHVFNLKTLVAKLVGAMLAVGSGLPCGPEGPIIHIGALLGSALPEMRSKTLGWMGPQGEMWKTFRSSKYRRDFITGGAGAGVSAAFSAPVGGLLFVFEEVSSYWEPRLTWMVFVACLVAFMVNGLFRSAFIEGASEPHFTGKFGYFTNEVDTVFPMNSQKEANILLTLPSLLVGLLGGVLGAIFTFMNLKFVRFRLAWIAPKKWLRVAEPVFFVMVFLTVSFFVAVSTPCEDLPDKVRNMCSAEDEPHFCEMLVTKICHQPEHAKHPERWSPAATLFLNPGDDVIKIMFQSDVNGIDFGYALLALFFAVYYLGACYTAGMAISSGLVVPMLVIGSLYGRICGKIMSEITQGDLEWVDEAVLSLLGAASFFGGVSRLTVSLSVIMFEVSGAAHFVPLMMLCILLAKWVADFATHSLYHALLEVKCVPFLDFLCDIPRMECFQAADIMTRDVVTLEEIPTVSDVLYVLQQYKHSGFPVVGLRGGRKVFTGVILRRQLVVLLRISDLFSHDPVHPRHPTRDEYDKAESDLFLMGDMIIPDVSDDDLGKWIDLRPHVNNSSFTVSATCAVNLVRTLFRSLTLRHLVVVDETNAVVGIITRKDLIGQAIEEGMQRRVEKAEEGSPVSYTTLGGFSGDLDHILDTLPKSMTVTELLHALARRTGKSEIMQEVELFLDSQKGFPAAGPRVSAVAE